MLTKTTESALMALLYLTSEDAREPIPPRKVAVLCHFQSQGSLEDLFSKTGTGMEPDPRRHFMR